MLSLPDLDPLHRVLMQAAETELTPRFADVKRARKQDGSVVTAADLAMQERVRAELAERWPEFGFLGEEMEEKEQRRLLQHADRPLWCLDPLDGTNNFAAGIPFFSVSLALIHEGECVLGLIYDPSRNECFSARKGEGAWLNQEPLSAQPAGVGLARSIALVDLKRLPAVLARRLAEKPPYSSQRSFGSVALDWAWIAAGRGHVYLHGRQKIWDYAAGTLILAEAGGYSRTLDGERVFKADMRPRSAIAALDGRLFNEWTAWLHR